MKKMLARCLDGNENSLFDLVHDFAAIEIKILFVKLTIVYNLNLVASKSWARIKRGIIVPKQIPYWHLSSFWV